MTLSTLIKKNGLADSATATPATIATHKVVEAPTVAPVATVAVTAKPEPLPELSLDEENIIRAWLAHIEENDSIIIDEVLAKCRDNLVTRCYFLKRSEEVPEAVAINESITCYDCIHFERINHPNLGHCARGEPEAISGLWDTDNRYCKQYQSSLNTSADDK